MSPINSNRLTPLQNVTDKSNFLVCEQMIGTVFPVIPRRLSFTIHRDEEHTKMCIKHDMKTFYFSSWMHESYESFCCDFGPVDLAATVRFCDMLREKLLDPRLKGRHMVYYCEADAAYFTNLAYLLGAYLVLVEKWTPEAAAKHFADTVDSSMIRPFRDAARNQSTFDLTLLDCFLGLQRAVESGIFKYSEFDVEKFELMRDPCNADASEICPKFIAFRGPMSSSYRSSGEFRASNTIKEFVLEPAEYVGLFQGLGVSTVVRLNDTATYNREAFLQHNIHHHDLFFEDCSTPSLEVVQQFHAVCDAAAGKVAVHCMAGLGRTGTLIATWIIKHFRWTARETIAWLRIVRPGSVMGPQQHFLEWYESTLKSTQTPTLAEQSGSHCGELL